MPELRVMAVSLVKVGIMCLGLRCALRSEGMVPLESSRIRVSLGASYIYRHVWRGGFVLKA